MNHKKLLIATLATAISGITFAAEVTIPVVTQPQPPVQKLLSDCNRLGKSETCDQYKEFLKTELAIIEEAGVFNWTDEAIAQHKAFAEKIAAEIGQYKENAQKLPENIEEIASSILETAQEAAAQVGQEIQKELGLPQHSNE